MRRIVVVTVLAVAACRPVRSCISGGEPAPVYDTSPECRGEVFATSTEDPFWLAVDRTHVWWQLRNGAVLRFDKAGGRAPVRIELATHAADLRVDRGSLFWTVGAELRRADTPDAGDRRLVADLATIAGKGGLVEICALDDDSVYLVVERGDAPGSYRLVAVPKAGGAPRALTTCDLGGCAADGGVAYFARDDALVGVPVRGGPEVVLAHDIGPGLRVAVDGESVYFATSSGGVRRVPRTGGAIGAVWNTDASELAVAGGTVWVLASEASSRSSHFYLRRLGAAAEQMVEAASCDRERGIGWTALAVDETATWFAGGDGTLRRLPR